MGMEENSGRRPCLDDRDILSKGEEEAVKTEITREALCDDRVFW